MYISFFCFYSLFIYNMLFDSQYFPFTFIFISSFLVRSETGSIPEQSTSAFVGLKHFELED